MLPILERGLAGLMCAAMPHGLVSAVVPPLPGSPVWERMLLEDPWGPATVLMVGALITAVVLARRQQFRAAVTSAGLMLLIAGAVLALGTWIETPREAMARGTQDMVFAVAGARRERLEELLAPDAELTASDPVLAAANFDAQGRVQILREVDRYASMHGEVTDYAVLEVQAYMDGRDTGRTQVRVRASVGGAPVFSWWRLDWQRAGDGRWRCFRVEGLSLELGMGRR